MLDVDVARCVINEDASTGVHFIRLGLSSGGDKAATSAANEVIDGNTLPGKQVVGLEGVGAIANHRRRSCSGNRASVLFAVLAGGAFWEIDNLTCCRMKSATGLGLT